MINMNDGSGAAPRLRVYFNLLALEDLPPGSAGPSCGSPERALGAIRNAGYDGVQFVLPISSSDGEYCAALGLGRLSSGRVNRPEDAAGLAESFADEGQEGATLHVGWGIESDDDCCRLIEAVLAASERFSLPLYPETHRATIFQDMWRTVQFVEKFPELRFNGDFSHWYTGLEMVYGGFENKFEFIGPVLSRVRCLHGRIGSPGCMQVDIGDGDPETHPYVGHFRALWTACFRAFLNSAAAGDYICFIPELLSPRIYYARQFPGPDGPREECDRWQQSLVLRRIAEECFREAVAGGNAG